MLTSAWLLIEQKQYARALEQMIATQTALADRKSHSFHVLADLIAGIAEIRSGNVERAASRSVDQKSRHDPDDRLESNWVAALDGEVALAQGRYDEAVSSLTSEQKKVWLPLGRDSSTLFATNLLWRDGPARVAAARGNRAVAIDEYKRLIAAAGGPLEPRYMLELARLLDEHGSEAGARAEYERFLKLWANADTGMPEFTEARKALTRAP